MAYQRTLFSLCYWHSVALSRRDLGSVGWSTHYPFGDTELKISSQVLLRVLLGSGSTVDVVGLRHLVGEIIYGGHIVDPFDRRLCMAYMRRLINENMMVNEEGCYLAYPHKKHEFNGLVVPQVDVVETFFHDKIINFEIPQEKHGPLLLGMHPSAQLGSAILESQNIVTTISRLLSVSTGHGTGPIDLEHVVKTIDSLLDDLPHVGSASNDDMTSIGSSGGIGSGIGSDIGSGTSNAKETESNNTDRLIMTPSSGAFSFLYTRERKTLVDSVTRVRDELRAAESYCRGETMVTELTTEVVESVAAGEAPRRWVLWMSPDVSVVSYHAMSLTSWISKVKRTYEFQALWGEAVMRQSNGTPPLINLSCILNPRALLAAVRLDGARLAGKSLDSVVLAAKVTTRQPQGVTRSPQSGGLFLSGLKLDGALWDSAANPPLLKSVVAGQVQSSLPVVHVYSMLLEEVKANAKAQATAISKRDDDLVDMDGTALNDDIQLLYECPVYANKFRGKSHLFNIPFPCHEDDHKLERWVIQGVAVVLADE